MLGYMRTINNDVGDPWRLTCPHCHSYDVRPLYTDKRKAGTYQRNGAGRWNANQSRKFASRQDTYRCNGCNTRLSSVYDKKQDSVVPIKTLRTDA